MRLAMLPAKTVTLAREVLIHALRLAGARAVRLHVIDVMLEQFLLVHLAQLMDGKLQIRNQSIAARAREILPHHNAHHAQLLRVRRHGVRGYDPAALAQLVGEGELVEAVLVRGVQAEGDEGQAVAAGFGHEDEAHGLHGGGEVVGCAGQVEHDAAVAFLAQAYQLVVLPDDLASASGEVQGERGLVRAEIVDIENKF